MINLLKMKITHNLLRISMLTTIQKIYACTLLFTLSATATETGKAVFIQTDTERELPDTVLLNLEKNGYEKTSSGTLTAAAKDRLKDDLITLSLSSDDQIETTVQQLIEKHFSYKEFIFMTLKLFDRGLQAADMSHPEIIKLLDDHEQDVAEIATAVGFNHSEFTQLHKDFLELSTRYNRPMKNHLKEAMSKESGALSHQA